MASDKETSGLAGLLKKAREYMDEYSLYQTPSSLAPLLRTFTPNSHTFSNEPAALPRPESIHAGTLLMGQSPEELHRWSQGNSPFMRKPSSEGAPRVWSVPGRAGNLATDAYRFKPDRALSTMDTVLLGSDLAGLAGLATRGIRGGVRATYPALNPEMNMSRREFMGNTGKAAAGLAVASAVPLALRGAEHAAPIVEHVVPHAAAAVTRVTPHVYHAANDAAWEIAEAYSRAEWPNLYRQALLNRHMLPKSETRSARQIAEAMAEDIRMSKYNELVGKLREKPEYQGLETREEINWRHSRDAEAKEAAVPEDLRYHPVHSKPIYDKIEAERKLGIQTDMRAQGWLPDNEIVERLKSGHEYTDPFTGNKAILAEGGYFGDLNWEAPHGYRTQSGQVNLDRYPYEEFDDPNISGDFKLVDEKDLAHHHGNFDPDIFNKQKEAHKITNRSIEEEAGVRDRRDYYPDDTDEYKRGGTITLPNSYRAGGRVRMI